MTGTREQVAEALFQKLSNAYGFKSASRRNASPETFTSDTTPALVVVEHQETYAFTNKLTPPKRTIVFVAVVYSDVGNDQNAIPATPVNAVLDAIDAALAPDNQITGKCTLGGLVEEVVIMTGDHPRSGGDVTGKSLAVRRIQVLLP